MKDDIGKAKPNTRKMPPEYFAFGKPERRDAEDAQAGKLYQNEFYNKRYNFSINFLGLP